MKIHTVRGQIELHEVEHFEGVVEKFVLVKYKGQQITGLTITDQEIEDLRLLEGKESMDQYRDRMCPKHTRIDGETGNGKKRVKKDLLKDMRLAEIDELADF